MGIASSIPMKGETMNRMEFEDAVPKMAAQFAGQGYSMTTLGLFLQFCRSVSKRLPVDGPGPDVVEAANAYVDALESSGTTKKVCAAHRRHVRCIESFLRGGEVDFSHAKRVRRSPVGGGFDADLSGYVEDMRRRGLKDATIVKWTGYAYRFLSYLRNRGLESLADAEFADVDAFLIWVSASHAASGMAGELSMLRSLLGYSDSVGVTANARHWVPRARGLGTTPVAPLSDEEAAAIVAAIDNTTAMGKRDLAIIMLAARTGIRSSEIVALRLSDIDWSELTLTVRRPKTETVDKLPMDERLASAIADYVLNGRPASPSEEVFLVHHAPYGPFSRSCSLHKVSERYYAAAGIEGRAGLHRMRHTAATDMLRSGATPDAIAAVLGHAKIENAMGYASIEADGLRSCCLPLPEGVAR